jgi:NADPH:quinone reductase-like Zn-dependent oxidoreductase
MEDIYGEMMDSIYLANKYGDAVTYAGWLDVQLLLAWLGRIGSGPMREYGRCVLTAWQYMIELGHNEPNPLQPNLHEPVSLEGKTILVNGAAGGVGHFAVQLTKWKGARVIAAASGKNEAFLSDLGVDEFIDYTKTTPEDVVRNVDLVIDAVGGPTTGRFLRTLKRGGALFPIFPLGFSGAEEAEVAFSISRRSSA